MNLLRRYSRMLLLVKPPQASCYDGLLMAFMGLLVLVLLGLHLAYALNNILVDSCTLWLLRCGNLMMVSNRKEHCDMLPVAPTPQDLVGYGWIQACQRQLQSRKIFRPADLSLSKFENLTNTIAEATPDLSLIMVPRYVRTSISLLNQNRQKMNRHGSQAS